MYLHGSVGTGKSLLLDLFHETAQERGLTSRRTHFHHFMLDVHARLRGSTMTEVSRAIASEQEVLCFDEFQVTDVADAVVLHELFKAVFRAEVSVVATSNRAPPELYRNGINRADLFVPFQRLLVAQCSVVDIGELRSPGPILKVVDPGETSERVSAEASDEAFDGASGEPVDYRRRAHETSELQEPAAYVVGATVREMAREMDRRFCELSGVALAADAQPKQLRLRMGRTLEVPAFAGGVARFDFADLCLANKGADDFLCLAAACSALVLDNVPRMETKLHDNLRRFINLVDILYDHRVKLVLSSSMPLAELIDVQTKASSAQVKKRKGAKEEVKWDVHVVDKGGSSGRLTTMLGEDFEWSATGRTKASLADVYAKDEVAFAIARAKSRLLEMQTKDYWNC